MKRNSFLARIIVAASVLLIQAGAFATTDFWTGGGGSANIFWLNTANWNPAAVPQAGDDLIFTNTTSLVNSNNITGGNFNSITFATPSGAFVLNGFGVTVANIADLQVVTPETVNLPITIGSGNLNVNATANGLLKLNNVISGTGALTNSGAGSVNVQGNNTFAGPLVVNAGTVQFSQETNLPVAPATPTANNIQINGGTLQALTSVTINTNHGIATGPASGSGQGTISVNDQALIPNQYQALRFGGIIANNGAGAGGITKLGFGNLILAGANTYTGTTSNQVGTLTLDFAAAAGAPQNNIISSSSHLVLGGATPGAGSTNFAALVISNKISTINAQTFNGTHITIGESVIRTAPASGGTLNITLGTLNHDAGGILTLLPPSVFGGAGGFTTTSANNNGILGGWATIGSGTIAVGWQRATNWACVDGSGNITNFTAYMNYSSATALMKNSMNAVSNIYVTTAVTGFFTNDLMGATSTNDVNSIVFENAGIAATANLAFFVGSNNVIRLGQFGGLMKKDTTAGASWTIGGTNFSTLGFVNSSANGFPVGSTNQSFAQASSGALTAGGSTYGNPGEIALINTSTGSGSANNWSIDSQITDNGPGGTVTVVLAGSGYNKFRNHNTYSGGTYLMGGRLQLQGADIGTPNPDGVGTGPIFVFPGAYLFGAAPITPVINIAGVGTVQELDGAWRLSGATVYTNTVVMFGDSGIGGGSITTPAILTGPISGNFNMYFGAQGNVGGTGSGLMLSNQCLWTGDTIIVARLGTSGNHMRLFLGENDALPHGFGKGNLVMGVPGIQVNNRVGFDLNSYNQTINGLISGFAGATNVIFNGNNSTISTLTIGDNDAGGIWGGNIEDTDGLFSPGGTGTMALTKIGGGIETFTNVNTYSGTTTISNGVLQLTGAGSINNSTAVNINGGTFDVSGASYTIPSTQTINVSGGTLFVSTATGNTAPVNFTNGTLKVASLGSANLTVPTVSLGGALNVIQPAGLPLINTYPTTFPVITYNPLGLSGNTATLAASLPAGGFPPFGGYVSNDNATATIYLVLTNGPVTPLLSWYGSSGGALNSIWDLAVSDWTNKPAHTASSYSDGSLVVFDDSGLTNVVSLNIDATPAGITFNNTNVNYTLIGSGGLHGASTNLFIKNGGGKVTLDNTGTNDLADPVSINGGTVQVGKGDLGGGLGVGSVANNGTIVFNRANSTLTVPNTISGSGDILVSNVPNSTTVLSGNSSFNGNVSVIVSNTVQAANANALGSSNGVTTIANGAALDVNGQSLPEWVTVSGAGVVNGGSTNGAIYNSNPSSAGPPQVRRVTMLGDTVVGAPSGVTTTLSNRLDIRGTGASLSTGGNAYKLTKVGGNQFSISGVTVDPALGDVDVLGGMLSVETSTTGLGNPAANLTMHNNTTLQLYNLAAPLNKQISMGLSGGDNTTINAGSGTGNTIAGSMVLNGPINVNTASGTVLTLSNALSGGQSITKNGTNGTLVISGADNHSGGIVVNDGTLILGSINNNGTSGNQITENPPISGFTLTVGGNGTNAAPMDIEDTLWPGVIGHPATLGVGDGSSTYNDEGAGALQFGEQGNQGKATFSLNTATTVGGGVNDLVLVNGSFTGGGGLVKVNPLTPLASGSVYTLIKYSTAKNGDFSGVGLVSSVPQPSRYAFTLDTTTLGLIKLDVTAGAATLLWNNAQANGVWDLTNNFNWHNTAGGTNDYFAQLDSVTFDDSIGGAGTVVNLTTTNLPYSLTVNSASNYTFNGSGKISGATGITKTGTGTLAINNTNDFTGTIAVYGGTLALNSANTGVSSVLITNGSVLVNDTNALGNTNVTITVTNSGTLDFGGESFGANQTPLLGAHPIFISGWGVNSNGCLINSSTNLTQEDAAQNITMTGDAAIGGVGIINGPGRFDIGRIIPATFSTGGHPYTLTKVGSNQVSFVSVTVDTNLGNIDIKGGELGFETQNATTTSMGNPLSNCVVEAGATLEFFGNNTNVFTKQFIVNGDGVTTNIIMGGSSGTTTLSGNMTLSGTVGIGGSATSITNNAQMSGTGAGVIKSGVVNLVLTTNETYTGNTTISGGTLSLAGNGSINSSPNISMASGTTIDVSARANNALTLASGQTLAAGTGTINGNLTNLVGTISLTGTNGSFTVTSNATFGSSALIANQLDHGSNTVMTVNGIVTYAGTLTVTTNAASTTTLTAGTIYRLFSASSYLGSFSAINLPALDPSLTWDTSQLTNNGTIQVVSNGPAPQPHITSISLSGTTLSFSATNGPAGGQYVLLGSTDVALPLSSWTPIFTNSFDGSGDINLNTNVVNTAVPDQFYIIKLLP